MKFLGKVFSEISRPINSLKREASRKRNNYKNLAEDIKKSRNVKNSTPVSSDTSKKEFKKRYYNLYIHQLIVGVFFLYSFFYMLISEGFLNFITSILICIFFGFSYVTISYKSYLSRHYYHNWEDRFKRVELTIASYIKEVAKRPYVIMPEKDIE